MHFLTLPLEIRTMVYKILAETSNPHITLFPDVPPYFDSDGALPQCPSDRCILRVCRLINSEATRVFPKPIYDIHVVRAAPIDPIYLDPLEEWHDRLPQASQKKVDHIRLILPTNCEVEDLRRRDAIKRLPDFNPGEAKLKLVLKALKLYFDYLKVVEIEARSTDLLQTAMNKLALNKTVTQVIIDRDCARR